MKALVNPFLGYLVLLTVVQGALRRRIDRRSLLWLRVGLGTTVLVAIISTPLTGRLLSASLSVNTNVGVGAPSYIFVLGGGYTPSVSPDQDQLVMESARRVLYAVEQWRRYPSAHLVFSGAADLFSGRRGADRMVNLMADVARERGVAAGLLVLEPRSRNTHEHPTEALRLPGVTSATPIGVVTSAWHMRRARREFCRYFYSVQTYSVPSMSSRVSWAEFVPSAGALDQNTDYIREWLGIVWYTLLSAGGPPSKC